MQAEGLHIHTFKTLNASSTEIFLKSTSSPSGAFATTASSTLTLVSGVSFPTTAELVTLVGTSPAWPAEVQNVKVRKPARQTLHLPGSKGLATVRTVRILTVVVERLASHVLVNATNQLLAAGCL